MADCSKIPTIQDMYDTKQDMGVLREVVTSTATSTPSVATDGNKKTTLAGINKLASDQREGFEQTFDNFMSESNTTFDNFMSESNTTFDNFMSESIQDIDNLYEKLGIIDLGKYEDLNGFIVTKVSEAFSYNFQSWVIVDESLLPYQLTGLWNTDKQKFKQYTFVTNTLFEAEVSSRQSGDASLQSQIVSGIAVVFSPQSVIQYHSGIITNSVVIPDGVNAWSFGPTIELADGVSVEIGNNSTWSIQ